MAIFRLGRLQRGVECRWGRQKSQFWANIWLHTVRLNRQVQYFMQARPMPSCGVCVFLPSGIEVLHYTIHSGVTDRGELMTLVAGKRRSLLMAGDDDEVHDKEASTLRRRQRNSIYCTQW